MIVNVCVIADENDRKSFQGVSKLLFKRKNYIPIKDLIMRKSFLVAIAIVASFVVNAQKFGVKAGLNQSSFSMTKIEGMDPSSSRTGFQVGGLVELPVTNSFSLQPELLLIQKGSKINTYTDDKVSMYPLYIHLPVKAMYKWNTALGKIVVTAGPYLAYGLSGKVKETYDGDTEYLQLFTKEEGETTAYFHRFDAGVDLGVGFEFKKGYFVDLSVSKGLTNIVKYNNWDPNEEILSIKNSVVILSIGYKFKLL